MLIFCSSISLHEPKTTHMFKVVKTKNIAGLILSNIMEPPIVYGVTPM